MKRYRVWNANRKVIYPDNWIEPEQREEKSPLSEEHQRRTERRTVPPPD